MTNTSGYDWIPIGSNSSSTFKNWNTISAINSFMFWNNLGSISILSNPFPGIGMVVCFD